MLPASIAGVVHLHSPLPAAQTLDKLESIVRAKQLQVFARIEFSQDAARAGIELAPMAQLIFGDPHAGTPWISAVPASGLALPLRALAWEDADGDSWLSYETPDFTAQRFGIPADLVARLAGLRTLCEAAIAS